jgi:hypothetical protein
MPDGTAQESFAAMMKSVVGPALRDLGFKGSGQTFSIPSETHHALLGFQKSVYSTSDAVRVTVNVCVVPVDVWNEVRQERTYLPAKPTPNTLYGDFAWQKRIGELMPTGEDTWWDVAAGRDTAPVASEIVEAVKTFALPAMRQRLGSP